MGRYYTGDIDGKFWFAVQSSDDADFFGQSGEPLEINYSFYKENINHQELIQYFGNKIKNIHIKDRNYQGETKLFGFGDTNFKVIFEILKKINYNENVILQLAREVECNEVNYISETLKKINKII
jgi:sugar phosphate isomerase/epimerase